MPNASTDELAQAVRDNRGRPILFVTGAGVSLASGLPTFRGADEGAVWANDVMDKGTFSFFLSDPAESWRWYLERFGRLTDAKPNACHHALAALERWYVDQGGDFLLVTQNVDGLHEEAGSQHLVAVHGRADRVRCAVDGCEYGAPRGSLARSDESFEQFRASGDADDLPVCAACGALLRPHVLWFDERYDRHADYQIDRVLKMAKRATLVVFAGTSFSVGVTEMILQRALHRSAPIFSVDPSGRSPHRRVAVVAQPAETAFVELASKLGVSLAK